MVANVDGVGDVLVDSQGDALYSPDQEAGGKVLCTDACTSDLDPPDGPRRRPAERLRRRAARSSASSCAPTAPSQVTFEGKPLYTFVEDPGRGPVTGTASPTASAGRASPGAWPPRARCPAARRPRGGGYGY